MFEYESMDIDEKKLEDLVQRSPHLIEEGLRFVDRQRQTGKGRLDVLLVDSYNALVVAELKVYQDDDMLMQALDYYDYVSTNLDGFARVYKKFGIDATQAPGLMLIAPSFSQTLINRCKWIHDEVPILLFSYKYIVKKDTREDTIVFLEIEIPPRPKREVEYSVANMLDYIKDDEVRQSAEKFLDEVKSWNPEVVEILARSGWAAIKVHGKKIAGWAPHRKYCDIDILDNKEEWQWFRIQADDNYDKVIPLLKSNFEKQGGKFIEPKEGQS